MAHISSLEVTDEDFPEVQPAMYPVRPRSFLPNQARLRLDWSPIQVIFQAQEKIRILIFFFVRLSLLDFKSMGLGFFFARDGPGLEPRLQGSGTNPVRLRSGGGAKKTKPSSSSPATSTAGELLSGRIPSLSIDLLSASLLFGVGQAQAAPRAGICSLLAQGRGPTIPSQGRPGARPPSG
jgi:hypothetical protein